MTYCRVESETNAYHTRQDQLDSRFRDYKMDNIADVRERFLSSEFTAVFESLIDHLWRITKVDGKATCTDSERMLLAEAIYVACAAHYAQPDDIVDDAKACFEDALEKHPVIRELTNDEIERMFDIDLPYLDY